MELSWLFSLFAVMVPVLAQTQTEYVWGSVVVTLYGDRIPLLATDYSTLTALGATQMNGAGALFRDRYLAPSNIDQTGNLTIQGINPDIIDSIQTQVTSMEDVFVQQSAQAFMAGLYPPTTSSNYTTTGMGPVGGPVGGLQYPQYYFASEWDPNYIYLNGSFNCPNFDISVANWEASQSFQDSASASTSFYSSLSPSFAPGLGEFSSSPLWFGNAFDVWDWLQYEANSTGAGVAGATAEEVSQARYLADAYMYAVYGNVSADGGIRIVGGTTLAAAILYAMENNVVNNGTAYKLNLYFTGVEAFISLASLLGLSGSSPAWTGMPNTGSSLAFELYSPASQTQTVNGVPQFDESGSNLFVRLMFRNGTNSTTNFDEQPLFGGGAAPGYPDISYDSFIGNMTGISLPSIGQWCAVCSSSSVWCAYYTDGAFGLSNSDSSGGGSSPGSSSGHEVAPVIAGVIGALVALGVAGLALVAAMLLFGVRFRRDGRGVVASAAGAGAVGIRRSSKRRSDLGGFKGGEKLASDLDLPRGTADAGAGAFGASVVKDTDGQGHRRIESWELREGRGQRQSLDSHRDGGAAKAVENV